MTMTMASASASAYPAASPSSVVSQPPISMNYDDSDRRSNTAMDTSLPAPLPATNDEGDGVGRRASARELICNYVIGKAKPLVFGQLLAFWLASTGAIQSKLHLDCNLSAPMFSSLSFYLPMSAVCLGMMFCGERKLKQRKAHHRSSEGSVSVDQTSISSDSDATTTTTTQPSIKDRTLARPEKRNHLISSWSRGSPTNDKAQQQQQQQQQQQHHDDSLNVDIPQTSDPTKPYSFFGLIPIHSSPKNYALIALFDVYASYTTILAFRYTTITSVALFDAFSIPAAIVVSRFFFGRRYTKIHLLGVLVCCVGISLNVLIDYRDDKKIAEEGDTASAQDQLIEADYPHKIAGDFLAIIGGILFGVVSTLQEVTVKDGGITEYLGCFAFFASIIAFVQAILTERQEIVDFFSQPASETCSDSEGELLFVLFAIGCIVKYVANGAFLQLSDAAFFNLSLLTGDAWSVAFSVFGEGIKPVPLFYVALCITLSGVVIYETAPSPVVHSKEEAEAGEEIQLTKLNRVERDDGVEDNEHSII